MKFDDEDLQAFARAIVDALEARAPTTNAAPLLLDAKAIGIDRETFRRAGKAGEFSMFKAGRKLVAPRDEVTAWIARRIAKAKEQASEPERTADESTGDEMDRVHAKAMRKASGSR